MQVLMPCIYCSGLAGGGSPSVMRETPMMSEGNPKTGGRVAASSVMNSEGKVTTDLLLKKREME